MKVNALVTLALLMLFGGGCMSMRRDEYGRALPHTPQWRLKQRAGDHKGLLRYDVVYVRQSDDLYHSGYEIVRFWPSGHYMYKRVSRIDIDDIDSYRGAVIGYYQVNNDGQILIEMFTGFNFGQYSYITGRLTQNGEFLKEASGSWKWWRNPYPQPLRYIPHFVGELQLQPDW